MIKKPVEPVVTNYLYRKASRMGLPLSGTFELTPLCNMNCKMCYVRLDKQQQTAIRPIASAEQWLTLGKKAMDHGMLYLLLTGGEPFSHPQCREIITGLQEMGLLLNINTNGTLIGEDTVQWLKKSAPNRMNVTLYGASDATYARLCGTKNGFSKAKKAILMLKEAGVALKINCSITPDNVDDLPEIVAFCHEHDLVLQSTAYMFPPFRRDKNQIGNNFRFSPAEAAYYTAAAEWLTDGTETFLNRQLPPVIDSEECAEIGDGVRCRAGRCSFWVTWDGKLLPCGMFNLPDPPNVFEEDFDESWEKIKKQVEQIRLPAACATCGLKDSCRACAAMVYTESGCFDEIPQYRCEMAHQFIPQRQCVKDRILAKEPLFQRTEAEK